MFLSEAGSFFQGSNVGVYSHRYIRFTLGFALKDLPDVSDEFLLG